MSQYPRVEEHEFFDGKISVPEGKELNQGIAS
jgi:hypothetical protein